MPCATTFSVTLQAEVLSTVTSDFLKQVIFLKSFNSVLYGEWLHLCVLSAVSAKGNKLFSVFFSLCQSCFIIKPTLEGTNMLPMGANSFLKENSEGTNIF